MPEENESTNDINTQPSAVPQATAGQPVTPVTASTALPGGNRKKLRLAAIIAAVVVVLGGASAGAYYGVVVPNKPENVLKKSLENTLKLKQVSGKGALNFKTAAKDGAAAQAVVVNYGLQGDSDKNTFDVTVDAAFSGVKFPIEVRGVDKALYFKVGDLGSIKGVASLAAPEVAPMIDQLSSKLSNQWVEVDESLLKSAVKDDSCSAQNLKLSDKDIQQILDSYDNNKIVTVKNSSSDKVDGRSTTKMELGFSKDNAKKFGEDIQDLDLFKKLEKCSGTDSSKANDEASKAEEEFKGTTNFTVWVDKSKKEIVKFALTAKDEKTGEGSLDFTFNKDKVDIKKPDGAKQFLDVFGDIGSLFGGLTGMSTTTGGGANADLIQKCTQAYQDYASSQGQAAIPAECMTLTQ